MEMDGWAMLEDVPDQEAIRVLSDPVLRVVEFLPLSSSSAKDLRAAHEAVDTLISRTALMTESWMLLLYCHNSDTYFLVIYSACSGNCSFRRIVQLPAPCYWRSLSNDGSLILVWSMREDLILADMSSGAARLLPTPPLGSNLDNVTSTSVIADHKDGRHFKVVLIYAFERGGDPQFSSLHLSNDLLLTPVVFDSRLGTWHVKAQHVVPTGDWKADHLKPFSGDVRFLRCKSECATNQYCRWPGTTSVLQDGSIQFILSSMSKRSTSSTHKIARYVTEEDRWIQVGTPTYNYSTLGVGIKPTSLGWDHEFMMVYPSAGALDHSQLIRMGISMITYRVFARECTDMYSSLQGVIMPEGLIMLQPAASISCLPPLGKMKVRANRGSEIMYCSFYFKGDLELVYRYNSKSCKWDAYKFNTLRDMVLQSWSRPLPNTCYHVKPKTGRVHRYRIALFKSWSGRIDRYAITLFRSWLRSRQHCHHNMIEHSHAAVKACDWATLPQDMLLLVVQHLCLRKDLLAMAHVCKAWNINLRMELSRFVEPLLVFWNDKGQMILFRSDKGWSPLLRSCFPLGMKSPMLNHGPWLVSWDDGTLHMYNLITREHRHQRGEYDKIIVKVGVLTGDDMCTELVCIRGDCQTPQLTPSKVSLLHEEEIDGSPYACKVDLQKYTYGDPYACGYPCAESDNMVIFKEDKCAYFSVTSGGKKWLLWYKWELGLLGYDFEIHDTNSSWCTFSTHMFTVHRPLVDLGGKLGWVRFSKRNASKSSTVQLEICLKGAHDLQTTSSIIIMPQLVWMKLLQLVELENPFEAVMNNVLITTRQCNNHFVHMYCTIASRLIAVIVYDLDHDLWDVIPFQPIKAGGTRQDGPYSRYFALCVASNSVLANVALSCKKFNGSGLRSRIRESMETLKAGKEAKWPLGSSESYDNETMCI